MHSPIWSSEGEDKSANMATPLHVEYMRMRRNAFFTTRGQLRLAYQRWADCEIF